MTRLLIAAAATLALVGCVQADMYLHAPAGTNNRMNEQNVNRNNNNRLWDSQNNNKGGYSVGVDEDDYENENIPAPATGPIVDGQPNVPVPVQVQGVGSRNAGANANTPNGIVGAAPAGRRLQAQPNVVELPLAGAPGATNPGAGYQEPPLEVGLNTIMPIEWTAQHACGPNDKTSCEVVIQYGCDVDAANLGPANAQGLAGVRDGEQTGCNGNGDQCPPLDNDEDVDGDTNDAEYGQHETVAFYQDCRARERNKGLFTADQNVGNNNNARARKTRQNPNGGRSGTECAEERDYYPYWHPSPFRDIAVLTANVSRCAYYVAESQNTVPKGYCNGNPNANNPADCAAPAVWAMQMSWDAMRDAAGAGKETEVMCMEMFWSRDNHLGNGADGQPNVLNWTVPAGITKLRSAVGNNAAEFDRCVLRVRYNITTGDSIDPAEITDAAELAGAMSFWDLTSTANGNDSPVHQDDPTDVPGATAGGGGGVAADIADAAGDTRTLQLALNTNQYGRTFEDRSLLFHIVDTDARRRRRRLQNRAADPKLTDGAASNEPSDSKCDEIIDLEIRGKRGNIVQAYPSVEHDFEPSPLVMESGDCVHLQFGLTDNDPPNNAGEGTPGTGRANFALTETGDKNKPISNFADQQTLLGNKFFETESMMFRWAYLGQEALKTDAGGAACLTEDQIEDNNNEQNIRNCGKLNPAGPMYDAGKNQASDLGTFHYMSTRENNFSNRSQKGQIVVVAGLSGGEIAAISLGAFAGAGALGAAAFCCYKKKQEEAMGKGAASA